MTQGEFILALAKLAGEYRHRKLVLYTTISKHANEHGLEIDENGPYNEQAEILKPLENFLQGVVDNMDMLWLCAHAHLVWEAHRRYLVHKDVRIRSTAAAEQSERRHAHRQ